MAVSVPGPRRGHAALVRGASSRNDRTAADDASNSMAGDSREISRELGISVDCISPDVPDADHRGVSWPSGFQAHPVWLRRDVSHFPRGSRHLLYGFGFHPKSWDKIYFFWL